MSEPVIEPYNELKEATASIRAMQKEIRLLQRENIDRDKEIAAMKDQWAEILTRAKGIR